MTNDYIVSSLPALEFGIPPALTRERFAEIAGEAALEPPAEWVDLETQLKNALVEARGGDEKYRREAQGCSLYWKNRVLECFREKDVMKREELLDRVWWDAAGELSDVASPLGRGALATYAVRLSIALRRAAVSKETGEGVLEAVTRSAEVKL